MVEKLTFNSLATALVDIPAVSTLPQLQTSMALCCVTKLHILEWPFIVPSTRWTCVMIMLFDQLLDMVRWMNYLGNGEMLTNRDVNKFVHRMREKLFLNMDVLFQLMKPTLYILCSYFCSVYFVCTIFHLYFPHSIMHAGTHKQKCEGTPGQEYSHEWERVRVRALVCLISLHHMFTSLYEYNFMKRMV